MSSRENSDVVEIPINGVLDLHAFNARDVADVVAEYVAACHERGILDLRLIHGKGKGTLRRTVHATLARLPQVHHYQLAAEAAGGWGATLVRLRH